MMRKYVLICNNRRKKILYYYDFRDECVYCIDGGETSKNAEKGARKGGYYGGIIGIFLYPVLGKASYHLPSGMLACISVLMGLVAAIWVVNYSLNYTEKLVNNFTATLDCMRKVRTVFCPDFLTQS